MKKYLSILLVAILVLSLAACGSSEGTTGGAKTDAELEAEGWVKNPEENGYVKKTKPDALSGSSIKPDPAKQLKPEQVRDLAVDYLRGWEYKKDEAGKPIWSYREMYYIATSYGGNPGISAVEYTLDPETMNLYTGNEKGTQKLNHMAQNPYVELYWVKQVPEDKYEPGKVDYWASYGVKLTGRYVPIEGDMDNPEFIKCASLALGTNQGAEKWDAMGKEGQLAYIEKTIPGLDYYKIEIDEVIVVSLKWAFNKPESSRPWMVDEESIGYNKDVYQFYTVERDK